MSSECIVTECTDDTSTDRREDKRKDSLEDFDNIDESVNEKRTNFKTGVSGLGTLSDFENKTELEKLILILKKGIKDKEPGIKYIKYPDLLVTALEELNGMIGLHRIKESVAIQTVRLIENLKNGEKSMQMLNTVLLGVQGVGKTTVGIKLAKIWFALGFLDAGTGSTSTVNVTKKTFFEGPKSPNEMNLSPIFLLLVAWIGTYVIQFISYAYSAIGLMWLAFFVGLLIFIIVIVYYCDKEGKWITKLIKTEEVVTEEKLKSVSDRDIITVVSRNDFVGEYLGHTSGKTKKLLEANVGKVLFIDEAYSLLNDPRDSYGHECLSTLNLFLSENPDKIVVIFAGYKEQMKNTIFQAQPGLERRCMWTFMCEPYAGDELADIFFLMASKGNWIINQTDKVKIKRLIVKNESAFKAQGGDMNRLLYLASLEASRGNLSGITESFLSTDSSTSKSGKKEKVLTFHDVEQGLISLKENRF